jgi:biotin transport system substrate-specific component
VTSAAQSNRVLLATALWPQASAYRNALLAVVGSLLLTLSAKMQIPFWPVPMTMQTYVVLVLGMAFGPRLGVATVLVYLLEGAIGLPVFAGTPEKGIGLAYMAGPTGGYLVGFVAAAALAGWLAQRGWDRSLGSTFIAMTLAHAVIFIGGLAWLAVLFGFEKALAVGLYPFLAATLAKTLLGTITMPLAWRLLRAAP